MHMTQNKVSRVRRRCGAVVAAAAIATLTVAVPANAAAGDVTTLAGSGAAGLVNGSGVAASFNTPSGVAVSGSSVYVADAGNHVIRKVSLPGGAVTTVAGSGLPGLVNGNGASASFHTPTGVVVSGSDLYIADSGNHAIRKISSTGAVTTVAGSGSPGLVDATGTAASFNYPIGLAVSGSDLYVGDSSNHVIRKVSLTGGAVTTFAGTGSPGFVNGTGTAASFNYPSGLALSGTDLYVIEYGNHAVRKVSLISGAVTTLAGSGSTGLVNGTGAAASFNFPLGIALDGSGSLLVADTTNNVIRKVSLPGGVVSTLAGTGSPGLVNGTSAAASFNDPPSIGVDAAGNVFVADRGNHVIRQIEAPSAGVSMLQPLPLLVAGFGLCVGGVLLQTRRRRSCRPTVTPTH
jgi:NHL repeat